MPQPPHSNNNPVARSWCFTLNNPQLEPQALYEALNNALPLRYLVFQLERGQAGTTHYQGYAEMTSGVRFRAIKNVIPAAHIEKRRGRRDQARDYCRKTDTRQEGPYEFGTWIPGQGARTDLKAAVDYMKEAPNFLEVVKAYPELHIKYSRGMSKTFDMLSAQRTVTREPPIVVLIYGPTGTGKTRYCMEKSSVYLKPGTDQWFDGYLFHEVLVIDDFAGAKSRMPLSFLLMVLDRYPVQLPVKGAFVPLTAKYIYVTSNIHPRLWYDYGHREEHYKALQRRFSQVYFFNLASKVIVEPTSFWERWVEYCDESAVFQAMDMAPPPVPPAPLQCTEELEEEGPASPINVDEFFSCLDEYLE